MPKTNDDAWKCPSCGRRSNRHSRSGNPLTNRQRCPHCEGWFSRSEWEEKNEPPSNSEKQTCPSCHESVVPVKLEFSLVYQCPLCHDLRRVDEWAPGKVIPLAEEKPVEELRWWCPNCKTPSELIEIARSSKTRRAACAHCKEWRSFECWADETQRWRGGATDFPELNADDRALINAAARSLVEEKLDPYQAPQGSWDHVPDTHEGRTAEEWYKEAEKLRLNCEAEVRERCVKHEGVWSKAISERDKRIKTLSEDVAKASADLYQERDFELTCQVEKQAGRIEELELELQYEKDRTVRPKRSACIAAEPATMPQCNLGHLPAYSGRGTIVRRDIKPTCQGPEDGDI